MKERDVYDYGIEGIAVVGWLCALVFAPIGWLARRCGWRG
jgi:hypothetical protein